MSPHIIASSLIAVPALADVSIEEALESTRRAVRLHARRDDTPSTKKAAVEKEHRSRQAPTCGRVTPANCVPLIAFPNIPAEAEPRALRKPPTSAPPTD